MGQSKKDNPEKLATSGIQDDEKHNEKTTQYVLDTTRPLRGVFIRIISLSLLYSPNLIGVRRRLTDNNKPA
jgi:hypothetical protein